MLNMGKRRRGDGQHMVIEIPYEFDCEYYNAFGYCRLRKNIVIIRSQLKLVQRLWKLIINSIATL